MELMNLKRNQNMPFNIEYISSDANILESVGSRAGTFGFIDLPIYLLYYSSDPSINTRRQNFYPIKREGYGFLLQKNSDWMQPVIEFFNQPSHPQELEAIIGKYLDLELYRLNEKLALQSNSHEELLAKEKEIQYKDLQDKSKEIEARTRTNYILTSLVFITLAFSAVIVIQYVKRNQQKLKIEAQQSRIELANRQLEQRNQHLMALDDEKNNLIKILAHDMRQPLSQIEGLSQLLVNEALTSNVEQKEAIQHIIDASQRLSRMIVNILDVDAIESKRIQFVPEKVPVAALVEKVVNSFKTMASKKNIALHLKTTAANSAIHADPLYLTQIIENLISNALKFSPADRKVTVSVEHVNSHLQIAVDDEGPGIAEDEKEKLFMKFQKLSARPTGGEASIGLGLAIVKQYANLMDGKVWYESKPGKGARFILEFESA
jgi:signal transduction histidine kinase